MRHLYFRDLGTLAAHPRLVPVQQLTQDRRIAHIRRGRLHRVDQLGLATHADVQLHPEIPLLALARLVHAEVARLAWFLVELGAAMLVASTLVQR